MATDDEIRQQARELIENWPSEVDITIDENAEIKIADEDESGYWISAWVWMSEDGSF